MTKLNQVNSLRRSTSRVPNGMKLRVGGWMFLCLGWLVMSAGCNPDYVGGAKTTEVIGKIFLDGQPVESAIVVFLPIHPRGANGRLIPTCYGETDTEGKFGLKQADGTQGAVVGKYRVLISKLDPQLRTSTGLKNSELASNLFEKTSKKGTKHPFAWETSQAELIPAIYNRETILTYEVDSSLQRKRPKFYLTTLDPMLDENPEPLIRD